MDLTSGFIQDGASYFFQVLLLTTVDNTTSKHRKSQSWKEGELPGDFGTEK